MTTATVKTILTTADAQTTVSIDTSSAMIPGRYRTIGVDGDLVREAITVRIPAGMARAYLKGLITDEAMACTIRARYALVGL